MILMGCYAEWVPKISSVSNKKAGTHLRIPAFHYLEPYFVLNTRTTL